MPLPAWTAVSSRLLRLGQDGRGATAVLTALATGVLIGFAALAVEVTSWYSDARDVRGAADAAAFSAAVDYGSGDTANYITEADGIAAAFGFVNGQNGVTVAVNRPPLSGAYTGNSSAIEVIITAPKTPLLSRQFLTSAVNISARAVATSTPSSNACVLALNSSASDAFLMNGSGSLSLNSCGVADNSSSSQALLLNGPVTLTAASATIVGNYLNNAGNMNVTKVTTGASATANPYAGDTVPSFGSCTYNNTIVMATTVLSPGVYCGGLTINGNPVVTMLPGLYIMNNGSLTINGNPTVTGAGVSIVLTSSTGSSYGHLTVNGTPTVTLSAMTTGSMAGFVVFQDPNAPASGANTFNGTGASTLTGALYFPNQDLTFNGSLSAVSTCTQAIAQKLTFNGNLTFNDNCTGVGVKSIGSAGKAMIVE